MAYLKLLNRINYEQIVFTGHSNTVPTECEEDL
jgi:hypothetical protein